MVVLRSKRGRVDATFLDAKLVDHVGALVDPLVAQVRVLVDVAALVEGSWAVHGGLSTSSHLLQSNVPALRDLVMAEPKHLGFLLIMLLRVLDQKAVSVALPVDGCPIMKLAIRALASCGRLDLHISDILLQSLLLVAFMPVGVVELD